MNEENNNKLIKHINGEFFLKQKEILKILKSKNYNPNITCNNNFGLLFYFSEYSEFDFLNKLIKHPDLDFSLNCDQVTLILMSSSDEDFFKLILNKNKKILKNNYSKYINNVLFEDCFEPNLKFGKRYYLKNVLLYLSIVENKLPKKDVDFLSKRLKIKNLTYQKLLDKIDVIYN
tara:strand:+ start:5830 stop:6354 length:525 start_codon:yes stop_codon:yes gene_type:complete